MNGAAIGPHPLRRQRGTTSNPSGCCTPARPRLRCARHPGWPAAARVAAPPVGAGHRRTGRMLARSSLGDATGPAACPQSSGRPSARSQSGGRLNGRACALSALPLPRRRRCGPRGTWTRISVRFPDSGKSCGTARAPRNLVPACGGGVRPRVMDAFILQLDPGTIGRRGDCDFVHDDD